MFQCSSASRKFLKRIGSMQAGAVVAVSVLFSEPKIPQKNRSSPTIAPLRFQCSSASRKFLKPYIVWRNRVSYEFQCSSASRKFLNFIRACEPQAAYRFQCSSASRKFLNRRDRRAAGGVGRVSVLFSEPKIPQLITVEQQIIKRGVFQCSSASRKFLNYPQAG